MKGILCIFAQEYSNLPLLLLHPLTSVKEPISSINRSRGSFFPRDLAGAGLTLGKVNPEVHSCCETMQSMLAHKSDQEETEAWEELAVKPHSRGKHSG